MTYISNLIIPLLVLFIIIYALIKKVDIFDVFVDGAKEGLGLSINTFPYMLGMIVAINILLKSNALELIFNLLDPFFNLIKIPVDILPMAIIRPISGSSALAVLNNILSIHGPDSFVGRLASVMQGSTDTTIYVLTLYFGSIGIQKMKYALWVGLISDLFSIILSIIIVSCFFN